MIQKIVRVCMLFSSLCISNFSFSQSTTDSVVIRSIYNKELLHGQTYENLRYLCKQIGPRLSGSTGAEKAVNWTFDLMKKFAFDTVFLQPCMVPHWERGEKEVAHLFSDGKKVGPIAICALGGSVATPNKGITADVIEVQNFDELKTLGRENIQGKIVLFNRAFDATRINTFEAYGGAVNQRGRGAIEAAKYGALAVLVRSMTNIIDNNPHTGAMRYADTITKIPACAVSTAGAQEISKLIKSGKRVSIYLKMTCKWLPDILSYNVVGEIRGSEFPDEIIDIGGHLDAWDLGEGAHDDGAGCMQSIEVLWLFKQLAIKPKRTLRAVMFMNEENGMKGGLKYAELAKQNGEKHIAAMESDEGGFLPLGFGMKAAGDTLQKFMSWKKLFEPYHIYHFTDDGGGVDIGPLEEQGTTLISFIPDSQRYFDVHHAASDIFENVNKRELELGAAAMTSLIYLISQYGL